MNLVHQPDGPRPDVLLYDGLCGVCDAVVHFILARDRRGTLLFAPLQGAWADGLTLRHPELARIDSLLLVRGGGGTNAPVELADSSLAAVEVLTRSDAVVAVGLYLGGIWRAAALLIRVVPRPVRDWCYDRFATVRHRVAGRRESCRVPTAGERRRFLD